MGADPWARLQSVAVELLEHALGHFRLGGVGELLDQLVQGDFRFAGVAGLGLEAGQFVQAGGGAAVVRVVVHHGLELLAGFVQLRAFLVGVDLAQPEVGVGPELPLGEVLQVILEGGGRGVEIALEQLAAGGGISLAVRFRVGYSSYVLR